MSQDAAVITDRLPDWVTNASIADTIEVWRPYYREPLTEQDAIEILLAFGSLVDALGDNDGKAVSGPGEGLEP